MTEIPAGLALYRAQLRDAIAQQDSRAHRRGRRAVAIGVPGAAAIAAVFWRSRSAAEPPFRALTRPSCTGSRRRSPPRRP